MHDVKGKHNLIMRGWTKSGAHAHSNITVFTIFFGRYGFNLVCYLRLCTDNQGMCMVPHAETCPPLPTQFFLLAQNLSSKQTYNIQQKESHDAKVHHQWVNLQTYTP